MSLQLPRRHFLQQALLPFVAAGVGASAFAPPAAAQDVSDWSQGAFSAIRLLAGEKQPDGALRAGLEFRLAAGYKTYWRNPGDAGMPPRFDWSGSTNVASVEVRWPAPVSFQEGASWSIGYKSGLILPLIIRAADPARPVTLHLKLDYAVCERMCVPAQGTARVSLPAATQPSSAAIARFEAQVPVRHSTGAAAGRLALLAHRIVQQAHEPMLFLEFSAPADARIESVFVEGPDMWVFGPSLVKRGENDRWEAAMALQDRPKAATGTHPFVITVTGTAPPAEFVLDLDFPLRTP